MNYEVRLAHPAALVRLVTSGQLSARRRRQQKYMRTKNIQFATKSIGATAVYATYYHTIIRRTLPASAVVNIHRAISERRQHSKTKTRVTPSRPPSSCTLSRTQTPSLPGPSNTDQRYPASCPWYKVREADNPPHLPSLTCPSPKRRTLIC